MIILHVDHLKATAWGLRACGLLSCSHAVPHNHPAFTALCCPNLMLSPHTPHSIHPHEARAIHFLVCLFVLSQSFLRKRACPCSITRVFTVWVPPRSGMQRVLHIMTALAKRTVSVLSPHDGHNDQWVACVVPSSSVVASDELCLPTLNRETCMATESRATCHGFHGLCSIAC
jgi:hypothetical protein